MTTNINLGGQSRPFCVGIGSLIEFERRTQKNFLQLAADETIGLSLTDLMLLAYCSLLVGARSRKQNFEYEEYEIYDWIDEADNFTEISNLITEGLGKLGTGNQKKKRARAKA